MTLQWGPYHGDEGDAAVIERALAYAEHLHFVARAFAVELTKAWMVDGHAATFRVDVDYLFTGAGGSELVIQGARLDVEGREYEYRLARAPVADVWRVVGCDRKRA